MTVSTERQNIAWFMHKSQEAVENCGTYFTLLCIYFFAHVFIDSWRDENKACKPANFFFCSAVRLSVLSARHALINCSLSSMIDECNARQNSFCTMHNTCQERSGMISVISSTWSYFFKYPLCQLYLEYEILISGIMDPFRVLCACGWISCWQKSEINLYKSDQLSTFVIVPKIWRGWYMCL